MAVTGFPTLEGNISVDLKYAPMLGEEFIVITANSITSCDLVDYIVTEFEGEEFVFEVICSNTEVVLKVVPEILNVSDFSTERNVFLIEENPVKYETVIRLNDTFTEFENLSISLINGVGQELKRQKVNSSEVIIQRMNVTSGMYFIQLREGNRVLSSQKIIFE